MHGEFNGYNLEWLRVYLIGGFLGFLIGAPSSGLVMAMGSYFAQREAALIAANDAGCSTYPVGCEPEALQAAKRAAALADQEFHNAHSFDLSLGNIIFSATVGLIFARFFYNPRAQEPASALERNSRVAAANARGG